MVPLMLIDYKCLEKDNLYGFFRFADITSYLCLGKSHLKDCLFKLHYVAFVRLKTLLISN